MALVALAVGSVSALMVLRLVPRTGGTVNAEYYCYELRQGWTCMYARRDCEDRLAKETQNDIQKTCSLHATSAVSP